MLLYRETSISDNIISPTVQLTDDTGTSTYSGPKGIPVQHSVCIESSRTQASGRGPTFSITRGSFFATTGGVVSGVDSGDDDDDDASAVATASPTLRL